jgi:hypothetical protein
MLVMEHLIPYPHVLVGLDEVQLKCANAAYLLGDLLGDRNGAAKTPRFGHGRLGSASRKCEVTSSLQYPQRLYATALLRTPASIKEAELLAQSRCQLITMHGGIRVEVLTDSLDACRFRKAAANLTLSIHASSVAHSTPLVQSLLMGNGQG